MNHNHEFTGHNPDGRFFTISVREGEFKVEMIMSLGQGFVTIENEYTEKLRLLLTGQ